MTDDLQVHHRIFYLKLQKNTRKWWLQGEEIQEGRVQERGDQYSQEAAHHRSGRQVHEGHRHHFGNIKYIILNYVDCVSNPDVIVKIVKNVTRFRQF